MNSSLLKFRWPWMFLWHCKKIFKLVILNQDILWKWSKMAFDKMQLPLGGSCAGCSPGLWPRLPGVTQRASLRPGLRERC